jgi:hypothetical protein
MSYCGEFEMKPTAIFFCLACVLTANEVISAEPVRAKTITCRLPIGDQQDLTIDVSAKFGNVPKLAFDYPSTDTTFSFRDDNLLVIAIDNQWPSVTRLVISAQLNSAKGTYDGQIVADLGGHQRMLGNGPVSCRLAD